MITLSIIIVSYNTKKITSACIDSIKKSNINYQYEIIVVDNASQDGSVEEFKKRKDINLILNNENLGFSKAVNIGIKTALGKYILILNSDVIVKKESINGLIEYAQTNQKDLGAVAPKLLNPDGTIQDCVYNFPTIFNAVKEYWFGIKGAYEKYTPIGNKPSEVDAVVMTCFLITPLALEKVGYLNEKYFMYFEDLDYCRELHRKKLKVIYLPDAEVVHHHGASGKNETDRANQWRRLVPSSKIYNGLVGHYILYCVLWSGQKFRRLFSFN